MSQSKKEAEYTELWNARFGVLLDKLNNAPADSAEQRYVALSIAHLLLPGDYSGSDLLQIALFLIDKDMFMYSINKEHPMVQVIKRMTGQSDD